VAGVEHVERADNVTTRVIILCVHVFSFLFFSFSLSLFVFRVYLGRFAIGNFRRELRDSRRRRTKSRLVPFAITIATTLCCIFASIARIREFQ
jgi:hypothetical protein